jgi:mRNA interferase RelE/StbE
MKKSGHKVVYRLIYPPDVAKVDLPIIDEKNKSMIRRAIEERLAIQPEVFGAPLQRNLKGYWKLRVGEYRVVYQVSGSSLKILGIVHRKMEDCNVHKIHRGYQQRGSLVCCPLP